MDRDRDWEMLCRVCLGGADEGGLVSLYDCDENRELLKDKYLFCSDIQVLEAEPLPSHICLNCVDRLLSAYQFKRQCISSYDTLKECLDEFQLSKGENATPSAGEAVETETVTVKQEDGAYLTYEVPVEADVSAEWPKPRGKPKRNRGRPRKYPDVFGLIEPSPYKRKKAPNLPDPEETVKMEEDDESDDALRLTLDPERGSFVRAGEEGDDDEAEKRAFEQEEDVLLRETILANSAPIPDALLGAKRDKDGADGKKRAGGGKKTYKYDRVHTCDQCGSSFRSNASLQAHIRRHLGIKPFTCTLCGYSCVLNMELRRHMMRHTGVKPYKCRICDRHFGDFGSRQKHERLHMGVRPYQCTVCGKSFTYSYVLTNHMLTHTGEKKYSCGPCAKRFTKAHHLKYHNKIHHKEAYLQQQLIQEAKKIQHINISDLTTVCTEQLLGLNQDGDKGICLIAPGGGKIEIVDNIKTEDDLMM